MWISTVYAVVLNWNLALDTIECIKSLEAAGLPPGHIVLVDNGSTDNSLEQLVRAFDHRIMYAPSAENLGFAGGTNLGISYASQAGAEWILLINNDTFVNSTFFRELANAVQARPHWSIISPMIMYASEPDVIWSLGDRRIGPTLLTRAILRNHRAPDRLPPYLATDSLNACAMLVHRKVFARIGGFDATYFMYAEDADFCWRARRAGFQMGVATRARMWHKVSRSTGVYHPQSRYWRIRNQIRFYRRQGTPRHIWYLFLFTAFRTFLLTAKDIIAGRTILIRANWRAWRDGWCEHKTALSRT